MALAPEKSKLADSFNNPQIGDRQPSIGAGSAPAVKANYTAGDLETESDPDTAKIAAALNEIATALNASGTADIINVLKAHGLVA